MYIPLANQLRPKSWDHFVYNQPIVTIFKAMLRNQRIPNGVLLSGARGIGKTTAARLFARSLNCSSLTANQNPCGQCESCLAEVHPDIIEISGATHGKVDDVRLLIEKAAYSPMLGQYKVFIIDEAQGLGASQSSWDALLKVLEEPPEHVVWVFCTTKLFKIPDTIKSRLVSMELKAIPTTIIQAYLTEFIIPSMGITNTAAELGMVVAHNSGNSMRDALTLLEKAVTYCSVEGYSKDNILKAIGSFDTVKLRTVLECIIGYNGVALWKEVDQLMEAGISIELVFSDVLVESVSKLMAVSLGAEVVDSDLYLNYLSQIPPARLVYLADTLSKRYLQFSEAINKKLVLQLTVIELCQGVAA